ncbi:MAG: nuclear transport factor 2 family protein [Gammaproteobacteria bacterium]
MSDEEKIREIIQIYFDGMYESCAEKCYAAFHPNARIAGWHEGKFADLSVKEWADFCAAIQPSPKAGGVPPRLEIISVEVHGDIASAWIIDDNVGYTFRDILAFVRIDGNWSIYTKLWHTVGPAQPGK